MGEAEERLAHLELLDGAAAYAERIHALVPRCPLLESLSLEEVRLLADFMKVYRAPAGAEILREGEAGDFMLLVLEGSIEVLKRGRWQDQQRIAEVGPGRTLGEMSMIDGEPRFATCLAIEPTLVAVLDRGSLARIIVEQPPLGAKLLMELVLMLSQRLRATSSRLLEFLDEREGMRRPLP